MTVSTSHEDVVSLLARYRQALAREPRLESPSTPISDLRGPVEQAWRNGQRHNPVFSYEAPQNSETVTPSPLTEVLADARRMSDDPLVALFADHVEALMEWSAALRSRDAVTITDVSTRHHGPVSVDLLSVARALLADTEAPAAGDERTYGADEAAWLITRSLRRADAQGWGCVPRRGMTARMAVSAARRHVELNPDVAFTSPELVRLAVHEVGTHVLRSVNGERQQSPLLALGIGPRHLLGEEGLAVWLEDRLGVLSAGDIRKYALRVVAVDAALTGGFADVYAAVRPHTTASQAFDIALRVKRGLVDTAEPGAYVKDKVYLEGWMLCRAVLDGNPDAVRLLWSGKISLDMVPLAEQLLDAGALRPAADPVPLARDLRDSLAEDLAGM